MLFYYVIGRYYYSFAVDVYLVFRNWVVLLGVLVGIRV